MLTLNYTKREGSDALGIIPAVFYGKKQVSTPISINLADFLKIWKQAGESSVISLNGTEGNFDVLIHDMDKHPVTGVIRHVDFYVFEKGKKIEVSIPLEFIGVSPAVKELSMNLVKVLREIKVSASPENLPHSIDVDISSLTDVDSNISAKDILLPKGVTLEEDPDEIVVSVSGPKLEELDEPSVAPDLSSIEVAKKGKKEEEEVVSE